MFWILYKHEFADSVLICSYYPIYYLNNFYYDESSRNGSRSAISIREDGHMKLLFKQRFFSWLDSYDIYDEYENTVYLVKGQLAWGHCLKLFDTFFFAGTSAAVFATVNRCFSLISCLCFFLLYLTDFQSFPVVAGVGVRLRIIFHIFCPADVVLIRTLFPNLIIRRLNKCLFLFFLQICVILFAFISCIRRNSLVLKSSTYSSRSLKNGSVL